MRNSFGLFTSALLVSSLAWAMWHWLGDSGFSAISTLAIIALAIDNARLRKQLKERIKL